MKVRVVSKHPDLTPGKEYDVVDGMIRDDVGCRRDTHSLKTHKLFYWYEPVEDEPVVIDLNDSEDTVTKHDERDGKLNYVFCHPVAQYQEGLAFLSGQKKYGDGWNYLRPNGHTASQLMAAAKRHIDTFFYKKEDYDPESSDRVGADVHHLACAKSCLSMLLAEFFEGTLVDDRPSKPLKTPTTKKEMNELTRRN